MGFQKYKLWINRKNRPSRSRYGRPYGRHLSRTNTAPVEMGGLPGQATAMTCIGFSCNPATILTGEYERDLAHLSELHAWRETEVLHHKSPPNFSRLTSEVL